VRITGSLLTSTGAFGVDGVVVDRDDRLVARRDLLRPDQLVVRGHLRLQVREEERIELRHVGLGDLHGLDGETASPSTTDATEWSPLAVASPFAAIAGAAIPAPAAAQTERPTAIFRVVRPPIAPGSAAVSPPSLAVLGCDRQTHPVLRAGDRSPRAPGRERD
jgi:hypothetical protein